ncbi:enoyl-[acyl-carrier-protein] reductase [NADH] [Tamilnaduibacter salinus]|uniref:Enoyl-[acyl-carrier-protein] reductase [NADH] n=1 Tax=Tamilnaduibacter salinus TaxID=1484056 RepID=A0A2U1CZM2_9GAMM|nr:enoyl-ACP reductase [Tamilnaduibacter salinus]PVY78223.1 enoyl-[acyl-carrier-protein] reductase [NADH] [Tamilnaduibacter salinus]
MGILDGKKALIVGVASKHSIAYGIADAFHQQGAELAFTYQNEKLRPRVEKFAEAWDSTLTFPCDVASDEDIEQVFTDLKKHWDQVDIIVHSVGFAPAEELDGDYVDVTTRSGFRTAHDISAYSFVALAKAGRPMLSDGGAMLTLTYLGAERVLQNYNVMGLAKASLEANVRYMAASLGKQGVRVNGISAGPIKTLAASGIKSFRKMLAENAHRAPLGRNITKEEVGNSAAFLSSDLASGITGEIMHVDGGFNITAMSQEDPEA